MKNHIYAMILILTNAIFLFSCGSPSSSSLPILKSEKELSKKKPMMKVGGLFKFEGFYHKKGTHGKYSGKAVKFSKKSETIIEEYNYLNGLLHGDCISWNEVGKKIAQKTYKKGKLDGKSIRWFSNGVKVKEGLYKDDLLIGEVKLWSSEGIRVLDGTYKNSTPSELCHSLLNSLRDKDIDKYLSIQLAFQSKEVISKSTYQEGEYYFKSIDYYKESRRSDFSKLLVEISRYNIIWDDVMVLPLENDKSVLERKAVDNILPFSYKGVVYSLIIHYMMRTKSGWIIDGAVSLYGININEGIAIIKAKNLAGDQATYNADNDKYGTLLQLSSSHKGDLTKTFSGYTAKELMKPTDKFFAVILSPIKFGEKEGRHYIVTSNGSVRYIDTEKHTFHNMPSTKASLDKIDQLPIAK